MVARGLFRWAPYSLWYFADSILETIERLQNGVGPRPESPLLLRD
jgi:hypothetical protein